MEAPSLSACVSIFCAETKMIEATMTVWRQETVTQIFAFWNGAAFMCNLCVWWLQVRRLSPLPTLCQEKRQSTCRTIKPTAQIYVGQNSSPSLCQVLRSSMGMLDSWSCIYRAVRRTRQIAEQGNHRLTTELLSISYSYVTLEWLIRSFTELVTLLKSWARSILNWGRPKVNQVWNMWIRQPE